MNNVHLYRNNDIVTVRSFEEIRSVGNIVPVFTNTMRIYCGCTYRVRGWNAYYVHLACIVTGKHITYQFSPDTLEPKKLNLCLKTIITSIS